MSMTEQHETPRTDDAPTRPVPAAKAPTVLDQMGGPSGFVYSTIPVIVFVTANAFAPLPVTLAVSIATGLGLTVFRM